jgi:Na+/H+-dicarboxylate symporter
MNSLRAIIVDDEPLCRQDLRDVLLGFPHIQICGEAANTTEAAALINKNMPDLIFLDLSLGQEIILVLTLMVTSKGIAGVPGVSFVVLLATLGSVGIPLEGLAFIAGVDRIMDMARTALNVVGNALAALVIARWEGMYDAAKGEQYYASLIADKKEAALVGETAKR